MVPESDAGSVSPRVWNSIKGGGGGGGGLFINTEGWDVTEVCYYYYLMYLQSAKSCP